MSTHWPSNSLSSSTILTIARSGVNYCRLSSIKALGGAIGLGSRLLEACRPRDSYRVDAPTTRPAPRLGGVKSPFSSARPRAHAQSGFTFTGLGFKGFARALGNAPRLAPPHGRDLHRHQIVLRHLLQSNQLEAAETDQRLRATQG